MSRDSLSQSDIDRMLGGAGAAAAAAAAVTAVASTAPARRTDDVQVYDFRRPHRVSKERLRTLEAMYERLVKGLEGWLIGRVRGQVEMRLQSVEQFSFGEFTLSLPAPCASYIFDVRDTGGQQGVIDFGHEFAYFVVDRMFGGAAQPTTMSRALTPIERMVVRPVAERVTALLQEIWQDHVSLDLQLSGFESSPDILQAANKEDPVLVGTIEVTAVGTKSLLLLCLPFSVLDKFFNGSGESRRVSVMTGSERERQVTRELAERQVRATRVPVTARLPEFRMAMRDLAGLRVGGVLATGVARDSALVVSVAGQERFSASAGKVGRKIAVRVLEPVNHPEPDPDGDAHLLDPAAPAPALTASSQDY